MMKSLTSANFTRREAIGGAAGLLALILPASAQAVPPARDMTIYRDPGCGCCLAWAAAARRAGYRTRVIDTPDMAQVKRRLGVPQALASCHTTLVAGLLVEGHVPLDRVDRLLRARPASIRGIAVPGMPVGSPGMESPDGRRQAFRVYTFDAQGRAAIMN